MPENVPESARHILHTERKLGKMQKYILRTHNAVYDTGYHNPQFVTVEITYSDF